MYESNKGLRKFFIQYEEILTISRKAGMYVEQRKKEK